MLTICPATAHREWVTPGSEVKIADGRRGLVLSVVMVGRDSPVDCLVMVTVMLFTTTETVMVPQQNLEWITMNDYQGTALEEAQRFVRLGAAFRNLDVQKWRKLAACDDAKQLETAVLEAHAKWLQGTRLGGTATEEDWKSFQEKGKALNTWLEANC